MNYYERHLGDYARDTGHLSPLEHGVYTLLLDRYYATETPIPIDQAHRICRARSKEEREAVDTVLAEFFLVEDGAYTQARVEGEIDKARARIDSARSNGKRGGRPKKNPAGYENKTQPKPIGLLVGSEIKTGSKALHTPDSIEEPPIPPDGGQEGQEGKSTKRKPSGMTYGQFVQACKDDGEKLIPPGHAVFRFAEAAGIPADFLHLAWREFARQYRDGKTKQAGKRGWRQKFENCVRRNWWRLWWFPKDGECDLTTAGVQLKRERDAEQAQRDQAA